MVHDAGQILRRGSQRSTLLTLSLVEVKSRLSGMQDIFEPENVTAVRSETLGAGRRSVCVSS